MVALRRLSQLRILLALGAVALLAGCASSGSSMVAKGGSGFRSDADYMYAVEKNARHKGVQVVWINPPSEEGKNYIR